MYFGDDETLSIPESLLKYFSLFETFNKEDGLKIFRVTKDRESDVELWRAMIDIFAKHEEGVVTGLASEAMAMLNADIDAFAVNLDLRVVYSLIRTCDFYDIQLFLVRLERDVMRRFLSMTPNQLCLVHPGMAHLEDTKLYEPRMVILSEYTRWLAIVRQILHLYVRADAVIHDMIESFVPRTEHLVAAGNDYSIVITSKGVFSRGRNRERQANHLKGADISAFSPIDVFSAIISVVTGDDCTLFLAMNGELYSSGSGLKGQLGREFGRKSMRVPLDFVLSMACGHSHSLVLTADGVYSFGLNRYGQLGIEKRETTDFPIYLPERVSINVPIVKIDAGTEFSAFVSKSGDLYLCGRIGKGIKEYGSKPTKLSLPAPVSQIACLHYGIVVLLVDGRLYAYGNNMTGELGIEDKEVITEATQIRPFSPYPIVTIIGKKNMITFIDSTDAVYVCGQGAERLKPDGVASASDVKGLLPDGMTDKKIPTRLFASPGYVIDVSPDYTHTLILRHDGLYGFGHGVRDPTSTSDKLDKLTRLDVAIGTEQLHFFDKREKARKKRGLGCHCCGTSHTSSFMLHPMSKKLFCTKKCFTRYTS